MRIPRPLRRRNSIVLTSLVDVMFVLLFFFMLVTTYGDWRGWSMQLAGGAVAANGSAAPLSVVVQKDGALLLQGQRMSLDEVAQRIQGPGTRAVLLPAPGVDLQTLVDVLDKLKPTGAALSLGREAP